MEEMFNCLPDSVNRKINEECNSAAKYIGQICVCRHGRIGYVVNYDYSKQIYTGINLKTKRRWQSKKPKIWIDLNSLNTGVINRLYPRFDHME